MSVSLPPSPPPSLCLSPEKADFIAKMRTVAVMRSEDEINALRMGEQQSHWLASLIVRKIRKRVRMVPVCRVFPYLLVGDAPWNTDETTLPEGGYDVCGKLRAPGSVWQIFVG